MRFKNPTNGYEITTDSEWAYALLFGPLYFAKHGAWGHAIANFVLALLTFFLSSIVYSAKAKEIVRDTYLRKGWTEAA